MKLSEYRKIANDYTAKASEITRQLNLGGIGIVWLFKSSESGPLLERFLIFPLIFLSLALLLDLIQYVIGGLTWITFFREHEKNVGLGSDPDIQAPSSKSRPIYILYYLKIIFMLFAYFFIVGFLISKL